jgi:arginase
MDPRKRIAILGAALDLGSTRRGVDMGPSAIRYAGLADHLTSLGHTVEDHGNVEAELPEIAQVTHQHAKYLPEILASCAQIAKHVSDLVRDNWMPLVLGGDHSIAMGTLAGMASVHGPGAVIWVDAHGDLNRPETSPTGNVHGMPLAAALGACGFTLDGFDGPPWVEPSRVVLLGVRSLDPGEKALVRELGLNVLTMADIDRMGIAGVVHEAISLVKGSSFVHLSLDVDACDPEIAPGVGTPVRGGLSYREAHLAMELISEADILSSIEVVEVNPILDHADETGMLAVELAGSALGARIL